MAIPTGLILIKCEGRGEFLQPETNTIGDEMEVNSLEATAADFEFTTEPLGNDEYWLKHRATGFAVEAENGGATAGTIFKMQPYSGQLHQKVRFEVVGNTLYRIRFLHSNLYMMGPALGSGSLRPTLQPQSSDSRQYWTLQSPTGGAAPRLVLVEPIFAYSTVAVIPEVLPGALIYCEYNGNQIALTAQNPYQDISTINFPLSSLAIKLGDTLRFKQTGASGQSGEWSATLKVQQLAMPYRAADGKYYISERRLTNRNGSITVTDWTTEHIRNIEGPFDTKELAITRRDLLKFTKTVYS